MRSPQEILFRLRQECANLWLLALPPEWPEHFQPNPLPLPPPGTVAERLRGTPFAAEVVRRAQRTLQHRFTILGLPDFEAGAAIQWRRDYRHGQETGLEYFRRIPYLDFSRAGDHKIVWELNRHQHLVTLAQAFRFTGDGMFLNEAAAQLDSWFEQNPFHRGINWTSALEVAFRALSWVWVWHIAGAALPQPARRRLLTGLYGHGMHLAYNLSVYFSPNTHLLGEAVALHALGLLLGRDEWRREGRRVVEQQLAFQVQADGFHFEQSTYYHVYALDFFLFHHLLEPLDDTDTLRRMAAILGQLMGPARELAFLGDDDGGRLFHPYGQRNRFGRATLETCGALFGEGGLGDSEAYAEQAAWWVGAEGAPAPAALGSRAFRASGLINLIGLDGAHVVFDAGPMGWAGAGHSHADALSVVARSAGSAPRESEEVLVDPGTFTYVSDAARRDWFRSTAAHSTITIDHRDQATPAGPFRWTGKPAVALDRFETSPARDSAEARCGPHRRRLLFLKERHWLVIVDHLQGAGEHHVALRFHLASRQQAARLTSTAAGALSVSLDDAERSTALHSVEPSCLWVASGQLSLPATMVTLLDLAPEPAQHTGLRMADSDTVAIDGQTFSLG